MPFLTGGNRRESSSTHEIFLDEEKCRFNLTDLGGAEALFQKMLSSLHPPSGGATSEGQSPNPDVSLPFCWYDEGPDRLNMANGNQDLN